MNYLLLNSEGEKVVGKRPKIYRNIPSQIYTLVDMFSRFLPGLGIIPIYFGTQLYEDN